MPTRRYGDLDDGGETTVVPALPVRPQPPIKTVKPRPRLVDRTPDPVDRSTCRGRRATPLTPAPQSPAAPAQTRRTRASSVRTFASPRSRVARTVPRRRSGCRASAPTRRPARPSRHAEPAEASAPPIRSVSGGITGAPAPHRLPPPPRRTRDAAENGRRAGRSAGLRVARGGLEARPRRVRMRAVVSWES